MRTSAKPLMRLAKNHYGAERCLGAECDSLSLSFIHTYIHTYIYIYIYIYTIIHTYMRTYLHINT